MTRNPGAVGADPDPFPTRPVSAVSGTADESFERQLESVSRFVSQTNPKTEPTVDSTPLETADTHDQRTPPSSLCRLCVRFSLGVERSVWVGMNILRFSASKAKVVACAGFTLGSPAGPRANLLMSCSISTC